MKNELTILKAIIKAKGKCYDAEEILGKELECRRCVVGSGCGTFDDTLKYTLKVYKEKYGAIDMLKDIYKEVI